MQAATLVGSGTVANIAALTVLPGARGLIASDRWNHASIIDACHLAGAPQCKTIVYSHSDAYDAERVVREARSSIKGDVAAQGNDGSQTVVVTDCIWDRCSTFRSIGYSPSTGQHARYG